MKTQVNVARRPMYASTALVGGERHLILRQHRPGWRGVLARFLRRVWPQYRRAEGGSLLAVVEPAGDATTA